MQRLYRDEMVQRSEEYKEKIEVEKIRRSNFPFYYYKKQDLDAIETLRESV